MPLLSHLDTFFLFLGSTHWESCPYTGLWVRQNGCTGFLESTQVVDEERLGSTVIDPALPQEFTAGITERAMHAPKPESGCIFFQAIIANQESDSKVTCTSSFSITNSDGPMRMTNLETVTILYSSHSSRYGIHHIPLLASESS